ncbi:hypothetical protein T12_5181 [Trichinella patagoniensis]|uniref:Uncharacterized protein n=1 Tax=Trichinella patagoniensis TaxID=990121 RepID=A0A0V1AFT7_9BILA|nr:hypothetical protein T12_5181 [Trichinella patagoniensis]
MSVCQPVLLQKLLQRQLKFHNNGLHYCYQRVMSLPFVYLFVEVGMGPDMEHGMWNMTIRFFNCGIDKNLYVEILYMITLVCIIKWKTHVVLRITKVVTNFFSLIKEL